MSVNVNLETVGALLVWQFLPWAAGWAQTVLYSIFIRAGDPKPQPGSPRFLRHRRQLLMAIYVVYFAFIIYEVDYHLQRGGNYYADLGVPFTVDERGLNSRFRKLTVKFHPDKVKSDQDRDQANAYYIHLKHARDILLDPNARFAYDRGGPDILAQCVRARCVSIREYVFQALAMVATNYGVMFVLLIGANALGFLKDGAYWRYLALLTVAAYEARTVMRPDYPTFLAQYVNPFFLSLGVRPAYLPFQATIVIRKTVLSAAQFLGFLIPLWRDDPTVKEVIPESDSEEARQKQIDRLETVARESNQLAALLVDMEATPYKTNVRAKNELKDAMKRYMMQNAVHSDRDVRNAMGQSYARRRSGAPSGAKGTR